MDNQTNLRTIKNKRQNARFKVNQPSSKQASPYT